jgi:hypothetical protein
MLELKPGIKTHELYVKLIVIVLCAVLPQVFNEAVATQVAGIVVSAAITAWSLYQRSQLKKQLLISNENILKAQISTSTNGSVKVE